MAGYPWTSGQVLTAADLDAAFANLNGTIGLIQPQEGVFTTLVLTNLPTSSSGLPTGALWNNGGVLCVA